MSKTHLRDPFFLSNYLFAKKQFEAAARDFPWYDSIWLCKYVAAKKLIERIRPGMIPEFVNSFSRLRTRSDFAVHKIDRLFDGGVMRIIRETIRNLPADGHETHEVEKFGRLVVHNHPFFTDLQKVIQPLVSEIAGEIVEPCYNFLSLYSRLGVCQPHMDTPHAKWTVDLCIDQSDVWPIYFSQIVPWPEDFTCKGEDWQASVKESRDLKFTSCRLQPNEAILFSGSSQWHYRDSFANVTREGFSTLLFFHYLPEGMSEIVEPKNWLEIFDMPELAGAVGLPFSPDLLPPN